MVYVRPKNETSCLRASAVCASRELIGDVAERMRDSIKRW